MIFKHEWGWLKSLGYLAVVLLGLWLFSSCAKRVAVPRMHGTTANGSEWAAQCDGNRCTIFAQSDEAFAAAQASIGCGVCTVGELGTVYAVEKLK